MIPVSWGFWPSVETRACMFASTMDPDSAIEGADCGIFRGLGSVPYIPTVLFTGVMVPLIVG